MADMKLTTNPNHGFDRWMYRGARPNRVARAFNAPWAKLSAVGVWPDRMVTLRVPGRHTGQSASVPLVVATYQGERYLVSMLGQQANWVQNVRAANGEVTLQHGRSEQVRLVEVDPAERAPILRRYLEVAPGARAHIPVHRKAPVEDFAAIAAMFPVFRITSGAPAAGS
jgi:deazaflavin-dependent oxidoreductase (nitroreductase family)